MAKYRTIGKALGHYFEGLVNWFDQEIKFKITNNPTLDTQGGSFEHNIRSSDLQAYTIKDPIKAQTAITLDSTNDTYRINSPYQLLAEKSIFGVKSSLETTGNTTTEIDKIDTLVDDSVHLIEITAACKDTLNAEWGTWNVLLTVTKFGGTVTIQQTDTVAHASSAGLAAGSITYAVNIGDVDIDVTGIAATTIQWELIYNITLLSTN